MMANVKWSKSNYFERFFFIDKMHNNRAKELKANKNFCPFVYIIYVSSLMRFINAPYIRKFTEYAISITLIFI